MDRYRSWMFVPGHSAKMVEKSLHLDLDVAILDLEDGVVPALKAQARSTIANALGAPAEGPARYVRINGTSTADIALDLDAVVLPGIEGIVLPKVENVDQVDEVAGELEKLERARGLTLGQVCVALAIETAKGLLAAPALAARNPRVSALLFGAEDFSRDIGLPAVRNAMAREFIHARSSIVIAARAAGIAAVDGVWPILKDDDGVRHDAELARALGFGGKSMVHPGQIAIINEAFSPSLEEVEHARMLVADFEGAVDQGHGSISFRGALVDQPIYERARATLKLAGRMDRARP